MKYHLTYIINSGKRKEHILVFLGQKLRSSFYKYFNDTVEHLSISSNFPSSSNRDVFHQES